MDWAKEYKPERKASIEDIAQAIRDTVSMDDVVAAYAPSPAPRHHRIPCPFHNGRDYNLSFTRSGYRCFVCGASGDVIGFVKDICECATRSDAMRRINVDFNLNLPIDGEISVAQSAKFALRRAAAERKRKEEEAWQKEYDRLMDEYARLDKIRLFGDPDSDEYSDAIKRIDFISFQIDMLECDKR